MHSLDHHLHPTDVADYLSVLPKAQIFLAETAYSPRPAETRRYTSFYIEENRLKFWRDDWFKVDSLTKIRSKDDVYWGKSNAMYATGSSVVWGQLKENFCIFWRCRQVFQSDRRQMRLPRLGVRQLKLTLTDCKRVVADLSADWVRRNLELELTTGATITIVSEKDVFPLIDPTYDGLNLMMDTSWLVDLAAELSEFLALPLYLHSELR